jgi:hypothetical protein
MHHADGVCRRQADLRDWHIQQGAVVRKYGKQCHCKPLAIYLLLINSLYYLIKEVYSRQIVE